MNDDASKKIYTGIEAPSKFDPQKLPPEVATLLIAIGVIGIPLPGPGIPFILAGGLALWPKTFGPMDEKFLRKYPKSHRQVSRILQRFESDMKRRYPRS